MDADHAVAIWTALGIASHIFWWTILTGWKDGLAWVLGLLVLIPAAIIGPLIFFIEWWCFGQTGPMHKR